MATTNENNTKPQENSAESLDAPNKDGQLYYFENFDGKGTAVSVRAHSQKEARKKAEEKLAGKDK